MSREAHVRFWESAGVKLPRATHLLVLSERHLRRILTRYFAYYHGRVLTSRSTRTHPTVRPIERPEVGRIMPIPEVGGLHHRYVRRAA